MIVVPVIDLMGGHVVQARYGERSRYRPLVSPLAHSSDPLDVARGLLALAPFPALYVADLDAIRGCGDHREAVRGLASAFPDLALWIDAGFGTSASIAGWLAPGITVVIGTESLGSADALAALLDAAPDAMLSLDTRHDVRLGPPELFDQPERWPQRVIAMTLERVGSLQGPSGDRLRRLRSAAPGKSLIAAGGVRDAQDLATLEALDMHAVLVASAIHDGNLDRS
ncbi:MAG: HisA/HisF-related TIM barrel protein, partial [Betaproteobacteria bacterium]